MGNKETSGAVEFYRDHNDWWIGYYRGDTHHYVCPLPTLVIRWPRPVRVQHGGGTVEVKVPRSDGTTTTYLVARAPIVPPQSGRLP